jgi:hypothetical protein
MKHQRRKMSCNRNFSASSNKPKESRNKSPQWSMETKWAGILILEIENMLEFKPVKQ